MLRVTSTAGLVLALFAVVVMNSPLLPVFQRNFLVGYRILALVGDAGLWLALGSLVGNVVTAVARWSLPEGRVRDVGFYACVNLATVVLSLFVPHVAAAW